MISNTDGSARSQAGDDRRPPLRVEEVRENCSRFGDVRGPATSLLHPEIPEVVGPRIHRRVGPRLKGSP